MPDICDRADEEMTFLASLRNASTSKITLPSALFCTACGDEIPVKRRTQLPGVQTCFSCQQLIELRDGQVKRMFASPQNRPR